MLTAVAAGEQVVLAAERDGKARAFDGIGVELDAAIIQESRHTMPVRESIADCFGQRAATRHEPELRIQPTCRAVNKSFRECPAFSKPLSRRLSADPCFDREEFADPAQGVCCHRRSGGLSYVVKLAPRVAPARGESDALLVGQLPEAGVSCDMQDASEVRNMRDWNAQPCGLRRTDRLQPEVQVHPMAEVRGRRPQVAPFCFVRGRDRSRESTPRRSRICNCQ